MDYPCDKFSDCSFSRFGSIVQTNRYTDAQTDANERNTSLTLVGVSKDDRAVGEVSWSAESNSEDECRDGIRLQFHVIVTAVMCSAG